MTLCICQHEERHHDNEAGKCDKIGCYCEIFRPDMEDYTDIRFGPIDTATDGEMMTPTNVYDHAAVQHGFIRKCLEYFNEEFDAGEREQLLEDDLPEYAATINEGGGYDLDQRIAALQAERDALREAQFKAVKDLKRMVQTWRVRAGGHYCQTYSPGMAQGLNGAAGMLEEYVNEKIQLATGDTNDE